MFRRVRALVMMSLLLETSMCSIKYLIGHLHLLISIAVLIAPSIAQAQRLEMLDPHDYRSPSGAYVLHVNPSERYGGGKASYRLTYKGNEVWSGDRPFTLWDAGVNENGIVGGYSYSHGKSLMRDNALFRVVILDRNGGILLEDVRKREQSHFIHREDNPLAAGLLFDPTNDRMIIRVYDADVNRGIEKWSVYRLSTAKPNGTFEPQSLMPDSDRNHLSILQAQLITGTNLTLLHWWTVRFDRNSNELGARFTLIDSDGKPVWTLNLPLDYTRPKDENAQDNLRREVWKNGAILNVNAANEFTLRFAAENKSVTFSVHQGADKAYHVKEISRKHYISTSNAPIQQLELPKLTLKHFGSVSIKSPRQQTVGHIRNIRDFVIDGKGRLAFLRYDDGSSNFTFVLVMPTGELVRKIDLKIERRDKDDWPSTKLVWVGGNRFLHTQSSSGLDAVAKAWWIDGETGQVSAAEGFKCPAIEKIAGFSDGRFVALATVRSKYTMTTTAYLFDAKGKLVHKFREGYEGGPSALFSPEDIAVTTSGKIVILDVVRANVTVFARNGDYLQTIDLTKAWKRKPSYASYLAPDVDGGFIVRDFGGIPPIIRMKSDGTVLKELTAKYPDGKTTESMQKVLVDPQGKLWTTDDKALLRLNDGGVVEHVLGNPPDAEQLGEIASLAIDSRGRIYALDTRNSAIHVSDSDGKYLYICKPNPTDFKSDTWGQRLTVEDTGDVYLSSPFLGQFLHFSPEGKRLGFEKPPVTDEHSESLTRELIPRPKNTGYWIIDYQSTRILDDKRRVVKVIERSPDGLWLRPIDSAIMAPDGSLAVMQECVLNDSGKQLIHRYDSTGKPQQTIDLTPYGDNLGNFYYDGEMFAFRREHQVFSITATGRLIGVFDIPQWQKQKSNWKPFLMAKHKQLWLFDGVDTIHKYSLP